MLVKASEISRWGSGASAPKYLNSNLRGRSERTYRLPSANAPKPVAVELSRQGPLPHPNIPFM